MIITVDETRRHIINFDTLLDTIIERVENKQSDFVEATSEIVNNV